METTIKGLDDVRRVYFKHIHARGCPTVIAITRRINTPIAARSFSFGKPRSNQFRVTAEEEASPRCAVAKKGHEVIKILVPTRWTSTGRE